MSMDSTDVEAILKKARSRQERLTRELEHKPMKRSRSAMQ